jgi:hypothetical protein
MPTIITGETGVNQITDGVITANDLASGSVTTAKIGDANITQAKLAAGVVGNGPAFNAYSSSTTSIPNTTWTKIAINTVLFDTNSNFNTSLYRFLPTVAGYYQINGMVQIISTSVAYAIAIWKTGTQISQSSGIGVSGLNGTANTSATIYLNGSSDYIELYMYQTSGSTLNAGAGFGVTGLSGFLARAA